MLSNLRRAITFSGGARGLLAMFCIAWGLQELAELAATQTAHLDELESARTRVAEALERERAIVLSWREERFGPTAGDHVQAEDPPEEVAARAAYLEAVYKDPRE